MKTDKREYTAEETAKFIADRNLKRTNEREAKKNRGQLVFLAKHSADYYLKFGFPSKGKTFIGSVREKFTGPRKNNFQSIKPV